MNQQQTIGKNTAILGAARLIERVSGVLLALFISRQLHSTGLGVYAAAMAYYELVTTIVDSGGTLLLAREVGKDRSKTNYYFVRLCLMGAALSVPLMAVLRIALPHVGLSGGLAAGMSIVTLAIIAGTLISFQESVLVAHQRTEFITFTALLTAILFTTSGVYLVEKGHDIYSLLAVFVITQYSAMVCNFYFINRYVSAIKWEFDIYSVPKIVKEIRALTGISVLASLFSRPEVIIISIVSSTSQVGIYSAALKIVTLWQYVPQVFMTNVFPVLARSYHDESQSSHLIQSKSIKYLLAISLPLATGIIATASPIVSLLYGPGFGPAVVALRILAFNVPLVALWAVLWRVLVARNRQALVLRVMLVITAVELGGGYLLISAMGSLGAALSASVSSLLYVLLLALYVKRAGSQIYLWRLSWRFAVAALGMGMVVWAVSGILPLWVLIPLGVAVYLALLVALKAFSADDVALFRTLWQRGLPARALPGSRGAARPVKVPHYIAVLWRRKKVVAVTTVAALLGAAPAAFLMPPEYAASTLLRIATLQSGAAGNGGIDVAYSDRFMNTYAAIATSQSERLVLAQKLGLAQPPVVTAQLIPNTELMQLTVMAPQPLLAARGANTLAALLLARAERDIRADGLGTAISGVVAPALVPQTPEQPRPALMLGLALGLGIVGGLGLARLFETLDTTRPRRDPLLIAPARIAATRAVSGGYGGAHALPAWLNRARLLTGLLVLVALLLAVLGGRKVATLLTGQQTAAATVVHKSTARTQGVDTAAISFPPTIPGNLLVNPIKLTFSHRDVGTTSALEVIHVVNLGSHPLTIVGVGASGTDPDDFSVSGNCSEKPLEVDAGCTIGVRFHPLAAGTRTASVIFRAKADHTVERIPLQGEAHLKIHH